MTDHLDLEALTAEALANDPYRVIPSAPGRKRCGFDPNGIALAEVGALLVCNSCGDVWKALDPRNRHGGYRPGPWWVRLGPFNRWLNRRRLQ